MVDNRRKRAQNNFLDSICSTVPKAGDSIGGALWVQGFLDEPKEKNAGRRGCKKLTWQNKI